MTLLVEEGFGCGNADGGGWRGGELTQRAEVAGGVPSALLKACGARQTERGSMEGMGCV